MTWDWGDVVKALQDCNSRIEIGGDDSPLIRPNVDVRPGPQVDLVADANFPLPLEGEKYDGVYSSFLLEHLRLPRLRQFLSELHRILKQGGVALVITANLWEQAQVITERELTDDMVFMLFGGNPDAEWNYHHLGLSPSYARKLFREAGFSQVEIHEWLPAKQIWGRSTDMVVRAVK